MSAAPVGTADRCLRLLMTSMFERSAMNVKETAADIARELREHPERWTQGTSSLLFGSLLSSWNDAPQRTVTDIIALCEKVASCADPGDAPDCSFDFAPAQYDRELAA